MASSDTVKPGKAYAPDPSLNDWGLRSYLICLQQGKPDTISKASQKWTGHMNKLSGSGGVAPQVDDAVNGVFQNNAQNGFQAWTGAAATAYQQHSQRVIGYGHELGQAIGGSRTSSLTAALSIAGAALTAAINATFDAHGQPLPSVRPATWAEAYKAAQGLCYHAVVQLWQSYAPPGYNQEQASLIWGSWLGRIVAANRPQGDPDLWLPSEKGYVTDQGPLNAAYNACFGQIWIVANQLNHDRAQTVCTTLNTLAGQYVKAYQALPSVPTAPPTSSPAPPVTPPPYPTSPPPAATPSLPVNQPNPNPSPNPNSPGGGNLNAPTSTAGLTNPTSTPGLTSGQIPSPGGAPSMPTTVSPGFPGGLTAPGFNPDLGHATAAAGLGAPFLGAGGLGAGGLGGAGLSTPKGIGGAGEPEGGPGAGGALGAALPDAAAMEAAEAANAAGGRGGMPMSGAGAGGKGNSKDRTRGVYLPEEEDVWGIRDGVAPPVIGGSW